MHLEIATPLGMIFSKDVKYVLLPGAEGDFGVLDNHAATIALLKAGVIEVTQHDGSKELVAIDSGHAKVDESSICVVAQGALCISCGGEMAKSIEEAKELLRSASSDSAALAAAFKRLEG